MTRYLVYTTPGRGHLYPIMPTLLELQQRGHDVVVYTLASEVALLRSLHFTACPINPAIEARPLDDWQARSPVRALQAALRTFIERARFDGPDLLRAVAEHHPDALLIDINAWGAIAAAETTGLPWANWCPYFLPVPSRDAPPFGLGLPPAPGPLGRLRDAALHPLLLRLYNTVLPDLNAARKALGAPALGSVVDAYLRAPLLLSLTAEPFEYPRSDWPASVRLVGPGLWTPPAPPPDWLGNLDRPLLLVTCSTEFQNDGKLIQATLDAFATEDVCVVATTPSLDPASFRLPGNASVLRFVSHAPLLERAVCVLCHGGMGITQHALAAGVPLVVTPFGRDQLEVARHVEMARSGVRLSPGQLKPDQLRRAVQVAIQRKTGAERVAAAFQCAGGPVAAADAVEALC